MKEITSNLKMKDIYFSEIHFKYKKEKVGQFPLNINFKIDYKRDNKNKHLITVIITTTIQDEINQLDLFVVCNGLFELNDSQSLTEKEKQQLLKINIVAIMFPYIRSQISIITSQPGLSPIQIPIIDVNKLLNDQKTSDIQNKSNETKGED